MENIGFGLQMTLVGMALVFGVLIVLWAVVVVIGRLDRSAAAATAPITEQQATLDPDVLAAVTVAVMLHAVSRRRQAAPEMRSTPPGSQIYASRWLAAGRTRQTRAWQRKP